MSFYKKSHVSIITSLFATIIILTEHKIDIIVLKLWKMIKYHCLFSVGFQRYLIEGETFKGKCDFI